jgi:peptidoglycan/LPS O-acetylase OafA/YrhL
MGTALVFPVVIARIERGALTGTGIGFIVAGCCLVACGVIAVMAGLRRRPTGMPSGVRAAVAANVLVLAFLALELSDRSVRQDGKLFYWTTFLLPPALLLFFGLVAARRWSWWVARCLAAIGVLWFLAFLLVVPFAPLQADGVPAPWYGRVYVAVVTAAFMAILAGAFRALGSPESRSYFGLASSGGRAAA